MSEKVLKPEWQEVAEDFENVYAECGCTCFRNPPCGYCTHEGNPKNLEETPEAWIMTEKVYVTFGQEHRHELNGEVFDKDCVAVIEASSHEAGRDLAFIYFSNKYCFCHPEGYWTEDKLRFFPRGLVEVTKK